MSAIRCPVCQGAFREVLREGILIDVCTQCRGVWLDRGELEKLLSLASESEPTSNAPMEQRAFRAEPQPQFQPQPRAPSYPPQPQYRREDDDDKRRYDKDQYSKDKDYYYDKFGNKRKKKKGFDMFDIFDFGD